MTMPRPAKLPDGGGDSRTRLLMVYVAGWLVVTMALALSFHTGTEHRSDLLLDRLAHVSLGYALCSGVALIATWVCLRNIWSARLGYVLIGAMTVAGIGMAVNLGGWCSFPGTWENPDFGIGTDTAREWEWIMWRRSTGGFMPFSNIGYTAIAAFTSDRLGPGISGPLLLNIMMLCGTLGCTARIATLLLDTKDKSRTAFYAALCMAAVASVIWYATIPMKEMSVTFAFTLFAVAIARLYKKGKLDGAAVVAAAAGGFLIMMVKSPMAWFLMAGVCAACARFSRHKPQMHLSRYAAGIYLLIICGAAVKYGDEMRAIKGTATIVGKDVAENDAAWMDGYVTVQRYGKLIPGYFQSGPEHRAALLPLTAAAQFFPPFPWNYTRDTTIGRFVWYAHLSLGWYLVAGAALGFLALCIRRRKTRGALGRWAVWWIACYLGVAYFSGGTVARYYLPFIPCLIPLSLRFAGCVRHGLVSRRSAVIYASIYATALAVGLTAAYIFLKC